MSSILAQLWRVKVVELFVERKLLKTAFAKKLLGWKHSGFSIESNTRIYTDKARESLCQYIVRVPVSVEKLYWDWHTMLPHGVLGVLVSPKHPRFNSGTVARPEEVAFQGRSLVLLGAVFRSVASSAFIARVTLHIPSKGKHLVRRYGVYASRSRGTWKKRPALAFRAADGWYGRTAVAPSQTEGAAEEELSVTDRARRKAWARLLSRVYEIDVLKCSRCEGRVSVLKPAFSSTIP